MEAIRVTHVLDAWKEQWFIDWLCKVGKREARRISKAAMKVGGRVDELIKSGKPFPSKKDSVEVNNCINAFTKWRQVYQPTKITPLQRLFSTIKVDGIEEEVEITGEPDLMVDGILVDIKCSAKISLKYWIQVMMYRFLAGEQGPVAILRLDKLTGSFEYVIRDFDESLVAVWVSMMRVMLCLQGEADDDDSE